MIVNHNKFHETTLNKKKYLISQILRQKLTRSSYQFCPTSRMTWYPLDGKRNLNLHISSICVPAANKLHTLIRPKQFWNFKARKVSITRYIFSNFSYCPQSGYFPQLSLKTKQRIYKRDLSIFFLMTMNPPKI